MFIIISFENNKLLHYIFTPICMLIVIKANYRNLPNDHNAEFFSEELTNKCN